MNDAGTSLVTTIIAAPGRRTTSSPLCPLRNAPYFTITIFNDTWSVLWESGLTREATCSCRSLKVLVNWNSSRFATALPAKDVLAPLMELQPFSQKEASKSVGVTRVISVPPSRKPDMVAIGVGSFGEPGFPKPSKEVHSESRHECVEPLDFTPR